MENWSIRRITDPAKGTGWEWRRRSEDGSLVQVSRFVHTQYAECLTDAVKNGYRLAMANPR